MSSEEMHQTREVPFLHHYDSLSQGIISLGFVEFWAEIYFGESFLEENNP